MQIRLKHILLIALIVMLSGMSTAQMRQAAPPDAPPPGDPRSPAALAILTQSLAAMTTPGSTVVGSTITSLHASGTIDKLGSANTWISGTFTYVDDLNPQQPEYKRSIEFQGSKQKYWSNHGDPSALRDASAAESKTSSAAQPEITKMHNRRLEAQYLPYVLLYQASTQPVVSVYQLGTVSIKGKSYIHLETLRGTHTKDAVPTRRDWYIDPQTMLPYVAMELVYGRLSHDLPSLERTTYTAYQSQDGLLWPMEQAIAYNGVESARLHLKTVKTNIQVERSMFDAAAGN
jgi:hypothetical protein